MSESKGEPGPEDNGDWIYRKSLIHPRSSKRISHPPRGVFRYHRRRDRSLPLITVSDNQWATALRQHEPDRHILSGCFVWYHATMKEFFHGWRRKAGVVTLVMACGLMGAWMRSQFTSDVFCWSIGHESEVVISSNGMLSWWRLAMQRPVPRFWNPGFVSQGSHGTYYFTVRDWGVELGPGDSLSIPYWPFVIPLTFFSAYLILWKPRKRASPD